MQLIIYILSKGIFTLYVMITNYYKVLSSRVVFIKY